MLADIAGYLQLESWPPVPGGAFWAALALIAGALIGELSRRAFGLPRIVGYSAVGLVLGLAGLGGVTPSTRMVVDLALALLLFELGSRVRLSWLRANPALLLTSVAEAAVGFVAIYAVLRWIDLPVGVALACATLGTCASGAVIARVAGEVKAAGQDAAADAKVATQTAAADAKVQAEVAADKTKRAAAAAKTAASEEMRK